MSDLGVVFCSRMCLTRTDTRFGMQQFSLAVASSRSPVRRNEVPKTQYNVTPQGREKTEHKCRVEVVAVCAYCY